jgi:hypothetical protein
MTVSDCFEWSRSDLLHVFGPLPGLNSRMQHSSMGRSHQTAFVRLDGSCVAIAEPFITPSVKIYQNPLQATPPSPFTFPTPYMLTFWTNFADISCDGKFSHIRDPVCGILKKKG